MEQREERCGNMIESERTSAVNLVLDSIGAERDDGRGKNGVEHDGGSDNTCEERYGGRSKDDSERADGRGDWMQGELKGPKNKGEERDDGRSEIGAERVQIDSARVNGPRTLDQLAPNEVAKVVVSRKKTCKS